MGILKIFISFAQKDHEVARRLRIDLLNAGADVFQYEFSATPGSPAWKQIIERLDNTDVFLLLVTEHSLRSRAVDAEIEHAHYQWINSKRPSRLIPLILQSGVEPPSILKRFSVLNLTDYNKGIKHLISELDLGPKSQDQETTLEIEPQEPIRVTRIPSNIGFRAWHVLGGHEKRVNTVVFSPDGKMLASGSGGGWSADDCNVRLWNVSNGSTLHVLKGHAKQVSSVAFSPDGKTLASGSKDCTIRLWNVSDGSLLRTLQGHKDSVYNVDFVADGTTVVSSDHINVWLWQASDGVRYSTLENIPYGHMTLSPDRTLIANTSLMNNDRSITLWRISDGECLCKLETPEEIEFHFHKAIFSQDGLTLAASSMRTICIWHVSNGKIIRTFQSPESESGIGEIALSPDGKIIAARTDKVRLWWISDGKLLHKLEFEDMWATLDGIAFSPDGEIIAIICSDKRIRLYNVLDGKQLSILEGHTKGLTCWTFSPEGTILATGSKDQTVRLWQSNGNG